MAKTGSADSKASQRDQILHWIGRVAHAHVGLDLALRWLYTVLGIPAADLGAIPEGDLVPAGWNFKKLVSECRSRLQVAPLDGDFKAAGTRALHEAANVNELRDRVVHDVGPATGSRGSGGDAGPLAGAEGWIRRSRAQGRP